MPRIKKELSARDLKDAPIGVHFVGGVGGLTLHVKPGSPDRDRRSASWVLRVYVGSKRRNLGLGSYPEVSISEARRRALEIKALCARGIDPVREKRITRLKATQAMTTDKTFKQVAEQYLAAHENDYRNTKHRQQWRNTIQTYAFPVIGSIPVGEVGLDHVLQVLEPIWTIKTETAKRLQGRLEKIFDLAITSGLRETNPARWKNYLSVRLPAPSRIAAVAHYPSVPYQELWRFMGALSQRRGMAARALEFLILTAVRSGSVRKARWGEIDLRALEWRIPKDHTKSGAQDHRVPLTDAMCRILRALPRRIDTDLIFPSSNGKMLSDMALNGLMRSMRRSGDLWMNAVPHGFRSTFRVWAAEATNHSAELAELVLMHTVGDSVYAAYQRSDLFEKRRQIMAEWNTVALRPEVSALIFEA
jgi:integrase